MKAHMITNPEIIAVIRRLRTNQQAHDEAHKDLEKELKRRSETICEEFHAERDRIWSELADKMGLSLDIAKEHTLDIEYLDEHGIVFMERREEKEPSAAESIRGLLESLGSKKH